MEEEALLKLQEAWDSSEQKDECAVRLDDLERAYWMGTEGGQLGGYGFQGVTLGVDGSCKVVISGPFIIFLLHNHFITEKNLKKNPTM